jgi:hypothetical protein
MDESSIGELFGRVAQDARSYASAEIGLYRTIAAHRLAKARNGAIALVAGALLLNAALITLLVLLAVALGGIIGPVLGGLAVFLAVGIVAYFLIRYGIARMSALSGDEEAIEVSGADIMHAKREAELARRKLMGGIGELQDRLKPGNIANTAWEGVKERSTGLADDAVEAVKARPVIVSAALGAMTLFLARQPIRSAVATLFARKPDEDLVTTTIDTSKTHLNLATPVVARTENEGASA